MRGVPKSIQGWLGVTVTILVVLFIIARVPQLRQMIGI